MKKKIIATFVIIAGMLVTAAHSDSLPKWESKSFKGLVGNIRIHIDGNPIDTRIEPMLMEDGITVIPLRDLSEALGFTVDWDGASGVINITSSAKAALNEDSGLKEQENVIVKEKLEDITVLRNVGPFYQKKTDKLTIAGRKFDSGIAVLLDGKANKGAAEVVLDLNQKYQTLEGYFGVEDETMNSQGGYRLTLMQDDYTLFTSDIVKPSDYPVFIEPNMIDLSYVSRLTIRVDWVDLELGSYSNLTPVLANFYFYPK
ncbi:MAG: NPCBM/NEW2 domain-containing protein [Bacillota bacterium]|nr:NPCBM/NEW2 domain-containing protein [Bacillota bacterium]